jgi:hypothetical protein
LQLSYTYEEFGQASPKFGGHTRERSNNDHFKDNSTLNSNMQAFLGHSNIKTLLSDRQLNANSER